MPFRSVTASLILAAVVAGCTGSPSSLTIYFIDVEGGQSTLVVTPTRQTLLIDAGFPGDGTFESKTGEAQKARDARRILAAAGDAAVTAIDLLLVTHFHADHDGGVPELSELLPIRTFIDHDTINEKTEENGPGSIAAFKRYEAVRTKSIHVVANPGDRLSLEGIDARVVSSNGSTISRPLMDGLEKSPACSTPALLSQEPHENPRSTGVLIQHGKFRFLDVGDLAGSPLYGLACPDNLIGPVDVYLVAHHGGADAAEPATLDAFKPRVAIVNNGATKGGGPATLALLRRTPGLDTFQLHRSDNPGAENAQDDRLANLDESTAHWIKLEAHPDGSFTVTNGRTGATTQYGPR
jgi:beta-lactamase superfamily II metal-dependent hydrolase